MYTSCACVKKLPCKHISALVMLHAYGVERLVMLMMLLSNLLCCVHNVFVLFSAGLHMCPLKNLLSFG